MKASAHGVTVLGFCIAVWTRLPRLILLAEELGVHSRRHSDRTARRSRFGASTSEVP